MKKILTILMILTISVVSVFAVEKSKTFGDFTVYFDTEDVDKCYINPQETALRQNLKIFDKMPAYKIKKYKGRTLGYYIIKKEAENGKGDFYKNYLLYNCIFMHQMLYSFVVKYCMLCISEAYTPENEWRKHYESLQSDCLNERRR